MAWFDIAAGLAQGAQQGIDRVQADQVRRKADAFKDAQEKRALAAEARLADQDLVQRAAEFVGGGDPNDLDPEGVAQFGADGARFFRPKPGAPGRFIARRSPKAIVEYGNQMAAALNEPGKRELETETTQQSLAAIRRQKGLEDSLIKQFGPDYYEAISNQPLAIRLKLGLRIGQSDRFLTEDEKTGMSASVKGARETAAGMRDLRTAQIGNYGTQASNLENDNFEAAMAKNPLYAVQLMMESQKGPEAAAGYRARNFAAWKAAQGTATPAAPATTAQRFTVVK